MTGTPHRLQAVRPITAEGRGSLARGHRGMLLTFLSQVMAIVLASIPALGEPGNGRALIVSGDTYDHEHDRYMRDLDTARDKMLERAQQQGYQAEAFSLVSGNSIRTRLENTTPEVFVFIGHGNADEDPPGSEPHGVASVETNIRTDPFGPYTYCVPPPPRPIPVYRGVKEVVLMACAQLSPEARDKWRMMFPEARIYGWADKTTEKQILLNARRWQYHAPGTEPTPGLAPLTPTPEAPVRPRCSVTPPGGSNAVCNMSTPIDPALYLTWRDSVVLGSRSLYFTIGTEGLLFQQLRVEGGRVVEYIEANGQTFLPDPIAILVFSYEVPYLEAMADPSVFPIQLQWAVAHIHYLDIPPPLVDFDMLYRAFAALEFGLGALRNPPCAADVDDGSGTGSPDDGVTIDDLLYYLFAFEQGLISADVDDGTATGTPDGGVTIDDLLYYLFRFESGC